MFRIREDEREADQTIKTDESERKIPLHPAVIAEGFMDYLAGMREFHDGDGPLFPSVPLDRDGRRNSNASDIVRKWLRQRITERRLTFHSWRHTVKTILVNKGVPMPRADYIAAMPATAARSAIAISTTRSPNWSKPSC